MKRLIAVCTFWCSLVRLDLLEVLSSFLGSPAAAHCMPVTQIISSTLTFYVLSLSFYSPRSHFDPNPVPFIYLTMNQKIQQIRIFLSTQQFSYLHFQSSFSPVIFSHSPFLILKEPVILSFYRVWSRFTFVSFATKYAFRDRGWKGQHNKKIDLFCN